MAPRPHPHYLTSPASSALPLFYSPFHLRIPLSHHRLHISRSSPPPPPHLQIPATISTSPGPATPVGLVHITTVTRTPDPSHLRIAGPLPPSALQIPPSSVQHTPPPSLEPQPPPPLQNEHYLPASFHTAASATISTAAPALQILLPSSPQRQPVHFS